MLNVHKTDNRFRLILWTITETPQTRSIQGNLLYHALNQLIFLQMFYLVSDSHLFRISVDNIEKWLMKIGRNFIFLNFLKSRIFRLIKKGILKIFLVVICMPKHIVMIRYLEWLIFVNALLIMDYFRTTYHPVNEFWCLLPLLVNESQFLTTMYPRFERIIIISPAGCV